jgi:predicted P-loop ATPase
LHVAAYYSERDNAPRSADLTWDQLVSLLTRHRETACAPCRSTDNRCPEKFGPAWSPVQIAPCPPRCRKAGGKSDCGGGRPHRDNDNVVAVTSLVLDFDGITAEQGAQVAAALRPFSYVAHTSHSHSAYYFPRGLHGFRAVVQLSRAVSAAEWRTFRAAAVGMLQVPTDPTCKDLSRLYFLPSTPAGGTHWATVGRGVPMDVDAVLRIGVPPVVQTPARVAVAMQAPPEGVDLDVIRRRLRQSDHPLAPLLLRGEPLAASGGRDDALNAAAGLLAFVCPPGTPPGALFEVIRPALSAMDLEPEGFGHWCDELTNPHDGMIVRALERRAAADAQDRKDLVDTVSAVFGAEVASNTVFGGMGDSPDVAGVTPGAGMQDAGVVAGYVQGPAGPPLHPGTVAPPAAVPGGPAIAPIPPDGDPLLALAVPYSGPTDPDDDPPPSGGGVPWSLTLKWNRDKDGNPTSLKNAASNVFAMLHHDKNWKGNVRLNLLSSRVELWGGPVVGDAEVPIPLDDEWVTTIRNWFAQRPEERLQVDVGTAVMYEQLNAVAKDCAYDPVKEYLDGPEWDGTPRIDTWLEDYLGAQIVSASGDDISGYVRAVSAKWLIAACARTYDPGCQVQNVLILEGEQGLGATGLRGKSSALAALTSREFFTSTAVDIRSPNAPMMTTQTWIMEIAEWHGASRAEEAAQKEFFSRDWENFRPPYGRVPVRRPRRCIFAGTINPDTGYMTDPTGNRRYWPVLVTRADVAAIEEDRDQLWAEARERYKAGIEAQTPCLWWLTPEEETIQRSVADERIVADDWDDLILRWWTTVGARKQDVRTGEVAQIALGVTADKADSRVQQRIGRAMKRLGFKRDRKREGPRHVWYYRPGPKLIEASPGAEVIPLRAVPDPVDPIVDLLTAETPGAKQ